MKDTGKRCLLRTIVRFPEKEGGHVIVFTADLFLNSLIQPLLHMLVDLSPQRLAVLVRHLPDRVQGGLILSVLYPVQGILFQNLPLSTLISIELFNQTGSCLRVPADQCLIQQTHHLCVDLALNSRQTLPDILKINRKLSVKIRRL